MSDAIFYCLPTTIVRGRMKNINVSLFNELRLLDKFIIIGFGIAWNSGELRRVEIFSHPTVSSFLSYSFIVIMLITTVILYCFDYIGLLNAHLFGVCAHARCKRTFFFIRPSEFLSMT